MRILKIISACFLLTGWEPSNPSNIPPIDPSIQNEIYNTRTQFPRSLYKIIKVPEFGSFYIDSTDDIIKKRLSNGFHWEPEIAAIIKHYTKPGTIVLDLGAHIGTHTLTMSRAAGPKGHVFAFEPQKKIFQELVMNMDINGCTNVTPIRCALGNTSKSITMAEPIPGNEGGRFIGSGTEVVPLRPLDSFHFQNVSFMKIDVENFEDFLLEGARETIASSRPVFVIEIQGNEQQCLAVNGDRLAKIQETIKKIQNLGYTVKHIVGDDYLAVPDKETFPIVRKRVVENGTR